MRKHNAYQAGNSDSARSHLVWFDCSGKELADYDPQETTINDVRALLGVRDVRPSPDNKRVAFASGTGVWTLDFDRKIKTRITFDQQVVQEPAWSPDGKALIFSLQVTTGGADVENPIQNLGRQRHRENIIGRAERLPLPRLVARWEISDLPLLRR